MPPTTLLKPPRPTPRLTAQSRLFPQRATRVDSGRLGRCCASAAIISAIDVWRYREFQFADAEEACKAQARRKETSSFHRDRHETTCRKPSRDAGPVRRFAISQRPARLELGTGAADQIAQLCDRYRAA